MTDDGNNPVLVAPLHVALDRPSSRALRVGDRTFRQRNPIGRMPTVERVFAVSERSRFPYSAKESGRYFADGMKTVTNASRRVSDSSNSKIRRAS